MKPLAIYYWLTPVFWILDEAFGANLRTAALDGHPWWKTAYYGGCIAIGVAVTLLPDWAPRLGRWEAGINIVLLVSGILLPYYGFIDDVAAGDIPTEPPITMEMAINFIIASAIWTVALRAGAKS